MAMSSIAKSICTHSPSSIGTTVRLTPSPTATSLADRWRSSPPTCPATISRSDVKAYAALLGTAEPATPRDWFSSLADGGQIVDDLHKRPWGPPTGRSSTDTAFIGSSGSRATKKTDRAAEAVLFLRGRMTVTRRAGVQATPTSTSRVNHHLSHTGSPLLSTGVLRRSRSGVPCCLTSIPPGSCGSAQAVSPSARWRRRECEQFAV